MKGRCGTLNESVGIPELSLPLARLHTSYPTADFHVQFFLTTKGTNRFIISVLMTSASAACSVHFNPQELL